MNIIQRLIDEKIATNSFHAAGMLEGTCKMITLKHNEVPDIPGWLFECPKCGDLLTCEIDEWEEMEDGTWRVSECGLHLSCASEPEIESKNWHEWHSWHFDMPYVYWLPLQARVWAWFNESYRFEPSNIACTGQLAGENKEIARFNAIAGTPAPERLPE